MIDDLHLEKNNTKTFRPAWWYSSIIFFSSFFMLVVIPIPVLMIALPVYAYIVKNGFNVYTLLGVLLLLPFLLFVLIMAIYYGCISVTSFFSYVKTTPEGIEYKYWPFANIRANWQDVDKINSTFLTGKFISLNKYEILGLSISFLGIFNKLRRTNQGMIPFKDSFQNKETTLSDEVKKYAPRLFEQEIRDAASAPKQQETKKEGIVNHANTDRLLACLSHGSIIFRLFGIFVPILILLTKNGKSKEVKYQSTQALIWQLFTVAMKWIFYNGLIVILSLALSFFSGTHPISDPMDFAFGLIIIVLLIIIVTDLLFFIFPFIGIVKIAQGKEFRYPIIGRIVRK